MNKKFSRYVRHLLPFLALIWTSAQAGDLTIPNTFQANTPAVAAHVNANFSAIETAVDDNHARIAQLENQVSTLEADATTANSQISQLVSQVTTLEGTVAALDNRIADLEAVIASMPDAATVEFINNLAAVVALQNDAQGRPSVVFSGVNVHVNNGTGMTTSVNGLGNLVVGYDEARTTGNDKNGSHNVVIGRRNNYSQYGGLVAGNMNTISGAFASVTGGSANIASGANSSVSGGFQNQAAGGNSSVSGGSLNIAGDTVNGGGNYSSISGGLANTASGDYSSVSGGSANTASGENSSVSGGNSRSAIDIDDWVAGGMTQDN